MIRVGIIGAGIIAREHAAAISMVPSSAVLIAAADVMPERLSGFCNEYRVQRQFADAADLIADPDVDLVVVATPPAAHEVLVIAALDAGKYVLCEKPLAHSVESAARIAAAEARHPGRLSVNFQLRFAPAFRRMLWLIENGWIGTIESAVVERHGYIPHTTVGKGGWWGSWGIAGGGVLMTQMIHEMDILLLAMGQPHAIDARFDTRYASIESEDWIEGNILFKDGRTARFAGSVNSGQMGGDFCIKGAEGSIWPGGMALKDPARQAKALAAVDAALPETKAVSMSVPSRAIRKIGRKLGAAPKPELTPHAWLYRDIAAKLANGTAMPIPSSEAMKTLQLCAGAYESGITGKETALPLDSSAKIYAGVTKEAYASRAKTKPVVIPTVPVLPRTNFVRIGLIGLDTTHVTTFADILHNPYNGEHIPGAKIVAGFAGGSPDMEMSAGRVGGFTAELQNKYGVPILDTPEAVADASDIVFILSCDGRTHPGLFRSVAGRGRPVFIDKPMAVSLPAAKQIYELAEKTGTKIFACSAFRYADPLVEAIASIRASGEKIKSCRVRFWGQIEPTQGRFFWYGIHAAEMLMPVMGKGIAKITATEDVDADADVIEVDYKDGRHATLVGAHNDGTFQVSIVTDKRAFDVDIGGAISPRALAAVLDRLTPGGYPRLWRASDSGSVSGRPGKIVDPDAAETLEAIALLDAAERSFASKQAITL